MLISGKYLSNEYRGIRRIEIPKTSEDFLPSNNYGATAIDKYFSTIISQHKKNAEKELFFYNYFLGMQDIFNKERLYQKDQINNNIVCENHALSQVDFKVSYITSEQREYTAKESVSNDKALKDDLTYLNRYFTDVDFYGKDTSVKEWVFATGIGCTDTRPNKNAIGLKQTKSGETEYYFLDKSNGFDIEYQAPFEHNAVSPIENFVVYSSGRNKEPLFCVSMVEVEVEPNDPKNTATMVLYQIETKYAVFSVNTNNRFKNATNAKLLLTKTAENQDIPIVEHFSNNARIGIIEINKSLYDSINTLISSATDMVVDNANMILVFKNTDIEGEQIQAMKKAGAIVLPSNTTGNSSASADLDTIRISIDYSGLDKFYQQRLIQSYDIVGVPLASSNTTSGGDTGQASQIRTGWNNAKTKAESETNIFKIADKKVLEQILKICKSFPNCPLNKITASQIEIKYKLNSNDNFLVKTQGIQNLYNVNMPKGMILKASGLVSDISAGETAWEEYETKVKQNANSQNESAI